jgi:hypothetical protein
MAVENTASPFRSRSRGISTVRPCNCALLILIGAFA